MIKAKHSVLDKNIYNINKKNYIINIDESSKVVFLKYQKQVLIKQAKNREWASFIETIRIFGRQLPLFIIFQGKK